jgi:hypothetical protein
MRALTPRHWLLVMALILAGAAAGGVLGARQPQTFESRAILQVGRLDINSQAVPGYVQASKTLAAVYSRIAATEIVEQQVAKRAQMPIATVRANLTAVNTPEGTTMALIARGSTARSAERLAGAAATTLRLFVAQLTTTDAATRLLKQYQDLTRQALTAERTVRRERSRARLSLAGRTAHLIKADRARLKASSFRLRADAAAAVYRQTRQVVLDAKPLLVLDSGGHAKSDHRALIQRFGFVGAIGGLVAGLLLATGLATRRRAEGPRFGRG